EDELLPPRAGIAQLAVEIARLPPGENGRLLLRQAGLHGEVGLRQEDGVAIVFGRRGGGHVGHRAGGVSGDALIWEVTRIHPTPLVSSPPAHIERSRDMSPSAVEAFESPEVLGFARTYVSTSLDMSGWG